MQLKNRVFVIIADILLNLNPPTGTSLIFFLYLNNDIRSYLQQILVAVKSFLECASKNSLLKNDGYESEGSHYLQLHAKNFFAIIGNSQDAGLSIQVCELREITGPFKNDKIYIASKQSVLYRVFP